MGTATVPRPDGELPAICLNMIVRDEAHIVHEVLDAAAPYITSWVIVDTGSTDGTQDVIRSHMADLGITGELHERPWRNFGENRSEALSLAQGHGDYVWVMDADDVVAGKPDFSRLRCDVYAMRIRDDETSCTYWRRQLFRDGTSWHYLGVVHEYAHCDDPYTEERLDGDYCIESRRLGGRNLDPQKYERDRDLLLAEIERDPDDARSVFYLAQSYFNLSDYANAREWSMRRAEMGGWPEEVYYSMFRAAVSMSHLGEPWPDVQDALLRAWEFRPTRAEPLHAIASRYRVEERYRLGHVFARRAAEIPLPEEDILFVDRDVYDWRAADEQAICASWIGRRQESFTLCRRLLARSDIPDNDRKRIADNRDTSVPAILEAAAVYPKALARSLVRGMHECDVTVSLIAGPDVSTTAQALNSFLNACSDVTRVGRFVVVNAALSERDRARLLQDYPFLEFFHSPPGVQFAHIRAQIDGRFWLHLGQDWRFFAPENYITRLTTVLETEPSVFQVAVNVGDADKLTGVSAAEDAVRRTPGAGRYLLADVIASGPAMFDTTRLDSTGGLDGTEEDPIAELSRRAAAAGLRTASLDEVLCIAGE